jgi:hypothetical protein
MVNSIEVPTWDAAWAVDILLMYYSKACLLATLAKLPDYPSKTKSAQQQIRRIDPFRRLERGTAARVLGEGGGGEQPGIVLVFGENLEARPDGCTGGRPALFSVHMTASDALQLVEHILAFIRLDMLDLYPDRVQKSNARRRPDMKVSEDDISF